MLVTRNHSPNPFTGWRRFTTDEAGIPESGDLPGTGASGGGSTGTAGSFVLGRSLGNGLRAVDVRLTMKPGEKRRWALQKCTPNDWETRPLPADPVAWFGGPLQLNGQPMEWIALEQDGAGYRAQLRGRVGSMFVVDVWLMFYPDQPAWWSGEALVTASDPRTAALGALSPEIRLQFAGGAVLIAVLGGTVPGVLVPAGVPFGDGQARALPLLFARMQSMTAQDWASFGAFYGIGGNDITRLIPEGNPLAPEGQDYDAWARNRWGVSIQALHTWAPMLVGVPRRSNDAGFQEDAIYSRADAKRPGAEFIGLLAAYKYANRPCHHLEADGEPLRLDQHPQLAFWDSRPHYSPSVSPDRLGKGNAMLTETMASGWWGEDVEHLLINTLAVGCRISGSPVLQRLMVHRAINYLLQFTLAPGISTSQTYSARAVGWEARTVVLLWENLEDRALAARVRERWLQRWDAVILPKIRADAAVFGPGVIDARLDDPRLGSGWWWITWQHGVAAAGLMIAAQTFHRTEVAAEALIIAQRVVADAWHKDSSERWQSIAQRPVASPVSGLYSESFNYYGCSLGATVLLRIAGGDHSVQGWARASEIMAQLRPAGRTDQASWLLEEPR